MTTTTAPSAAADTVAPAQAGRLRLVASALAAASATLAVLIVTHPWGDRLDSSADEVLSYDGLPADPDAAWAAMLADVFAFGVMAFCLAIAACHLVRTRGRVAATVGSVLVVAGGILSAMGGFAFATTTWFAGALPEESGRELVDVANDHLAQLLGAEMAGFLCVTLGSLVLAGALFRARAVPRLAVAVFVVLTVVLFVGLPGTAMDLAQAAQVLTAGALAVPLWLSARR
jgi:hypothetical protein